MSEAELLELYHLSANAIDSNFEFWLSITIAMIVVGFYVGRKISWPLSVFVSSLYFGTCWLFIVRLTGEGAVLHSTIVQLSELETKIDIVTLQENIEIGLMYQGILLIGTVGALVYFLNEVRLGKRKKSG